MRRRSLRSSFKQDKLGSSKVQSRTHSTLAFEPFGKEKHQPQSCVKGEKPLTDGSESTSTPFSSMTDILGQAVVLEQQTDPRKTASVDFCLGCSFELWRRLIFPVARIYARSQRNQSTLPYAQFTLHDQVTSFPSQG